MTKKDKQVLSGVIIFTLVTLVVMTTLQTAFAYSIYADPSDSAFDIRFATTEITGPSAFSGTAIGSIDNSLNNSNSQINTNTTNYNATNSRNIQNNTLITNILADNLEDRLQKAGSILNITSKLPQVRNTSFAYLLNETLSTLHGIPQDAEIEKRQIAQDILSSHKDLFEIVFLMPNGDVYFVQPYSIQQPLTTTNLAFRDYFQGAIRTNDLYLGNVITSAAAGVRESLIAVPVYSLEEDNSTLVGVWAGGLDFNVLNEELQSLNLTSADKRVVYTDYNGQKVADSDINRSATPESFANLNSFKNATNGQSGTVIDTVDNTQMLVTYQPVKAFQNTYVVLLMQPP